MRRHSCQLEISTVNTSTERDFFAFTGLSEEAQTKPLPLLTPSPLSIQPLILYTLFNLYTNLSFQWTSHSKPYEFVLHVKKDSPIIF